MRGLSRGPITGKLIAEFIQMKTLKTSNALDPHRYE
jgi:hypothetical protein